MKRWLVVVLALSLTGVAQAKDAFILYGDEVIGTHLRAELGEFPVPLDRPFHEMDEQHKAIIRADYGDMSTEIQPPFPRLGLQQFYRPLLQANQQFRDRGELMAIATVDKKGKVAKVDLYKVPSNRIGKLAGQLLMLTEFEPGRCGGKACAGEFLLSLNFEP